MLPFGKKKVANIIIKDHVIRYLIANNHRIDQIRAYGERYLPSGVIHNGKIVDEDTFKMLFEECVDTWKLKKTNVQFTVPDATVFFRKITIPSSVPVDEIRGYLLFEMGSSIHLPFEDPVFDYHVLAQTEEGTEILLFASPSDTLQQCMEIFDECKLEAVAADVSTLALYRLCHQLELVKEEEHTLLIEYDVISVNLAIFYQNIPYFIRHLSLNPNMNDYKIATEFTEAPKLEFVGDESLALGQINDTVTEVERLLNFYKFSIQHGKAGVSKIILAGDHSFLHEVKNKLQNDLQITVESLADKQIYDSNGNELTTQYMLTLGLALKEVR